MQRTASRAAIHVLCVCHPPVGCAARFTGLAVQTRAPVTSSSGLSLSSCNKRSQPIIRLQRNAFHRHNARLQSRSFARWNPQLTGIEQVHGGFSSQSFWKAGSPRKGSHCGWSLRSAGVRQSVYGISKRRCSLGIARFLSPTKTSTCAKFCS
jgi:hypothetical protein